MGKSVKHPLVIRENHFSKTLEALAYPLNGNGKTLERMR